MYSLTTLSSLLYVQSLTMIQFARIGSLADGKILPGFGGWVIGDLDNLIDNILLVDDGARRLMTYGEFESSAVQRAAVQPALDLFTGFSFVERPVMARILLAHALFMRLLLLTYSRSVDLSS